MNILFIGDICGQLGINYLIEKIKFLKQLYNINIVIANAENAAHGQGMDFNSFYNLKISGVNVMTMGNHTWKNNALEYFINQTDIIRPLNDDSKYIGHGYKIIKCQNKKILIMNALGRVFMDNHFLSCPFKKVENILNLCRNQYNYSLLDFHAQATSEKIALAHYFDGKIDAIVGTHTHVQTNDDRILPNKTLYISDVGMTGALNEVIGQDKNIIIHNFLHDKKKVKPVITKGKRQLNGVILTLGETKKIVKINYNE
ncbi:TIGR00282 family metallophosphoesterase [Candidatus Phytoplasma melaleucae]|uniref:TIGR00282 family metallophosphoesterase n=1 Tax=Candidatus Phytoplasma melaleucae TaxID=2982630 RepID=A0ABT9DFE0_9MOLU|nr:TIGR00282 family metallophosphoesterase ['Melaleuca sp.' phytoplasma]MDO8168071.1 TIGR00282 family metallophosphoesterase ['Melaleuca sp.' phytoplasma]MDV3205352.1 TIGR00282 family metallophosphoesterase [Weeping tea tree witches'-broom phytoplasma]